MERHDFSWQACQNRKCEMYRVKKGGNVKFHGHVGKHRDIHELKCTVCGTHFSEHKGTPFFRMQLPREKVFQVIKCLVEGNGIRGTERIVGIHRDTVMHILEKTAQHVEEVSEEFCAELEAHEIQMDELWTFVKKRNVSRARNPRRAVNNG